jgi:hypothetical protein
MKSNTKILQIPLLGGSESAPTGAREVAADRERACLLVFPSSGCSFRFLRHFHFGMVGHRHSVTRSVVLRRISYSATSLCQACGYLLANRTTPYDYREEPEPGLRHSQLLLGMTTPSNDAQANAGLRCGFTAGALSPAWLSFNRSMTTSFASRCSTDYL